MEKLLYYETANSIEEKLEILKNFFTEELKSMRQIYKYKLDCVELKYDTIKKYLTATNKIDNDIYNMLEDLQNENEIVKINNMQYVNEISFHQEQIKNLGKNELELKSTIDNLKKQIESKENIIQEKIKTINSMNKKYESKVEEYDKLYREYDYDLANKDQQITNVKYSKNEYKEENKRLYDTISGLENDICELTLKLHEYNIKDKEYEEHMEEIEEINNLRAEYRILEIKNEELKNTLKEREDRLMYFDQIKNLFNRPQNNGDN